MVGGVGLGPRGQKGFSVGLGWVGRGGGQMGEGIQLLI